MPKASFVDRMGEWEYLIARVTANQPDLENLQEVREQLETEMAGAKEANQRQATYQALAQQATRDQEGSLARGTDLANQLRNGIRARYGPRSEKLSEFGLRVLRKRKTSPEEKPASEEAKPEGEKKSAPPEATTEAKPQ
jgi:hypothetical protein